MEHLSPIAVVEQLDRAVADEEGEERAADLWVPRPRQLANCERRPTRSETHLDCHDQLGESLFPQRPNVDEEKAGESLACQLKRASCRGRGLRPLT